MQHIKVSDLRVSKFVSVMPEVFECNSGFATHDMPIIVTMDNVVLAISVAMFEYYKHSKYVEVPCFVIPDCYTHQLDLQYLNFSRGQVVRYHEIRNTYDNPAMLEDIGFDNSELDFMYKVNLDNDRYDIKVLESDAVVLKKDQFFTIKCKTREESILVRQFFQTVDHEITFDKFRKHIKKEVNSLASLFGEKEESIPVEKLEAKCDTNFRIKYEDENQLKEIFDIFRLSTKKKTVRISYKLIKDILI